MSSDHSHLLLGTSIGHIVILNWEGEMLQAITSDSLISHATAQQLQQNQHQQNDGSEQHHAQQAHSAAAQGEVVSIVVFASCST